MPSCDSNQFDNEIEHKSAQGELFGLLGTSFDIELPAKATLADVRDKLARHVLLTELIDGLGSSVPAPLGSAQIAAAPNGLDACVRLAKTWRQLRDYRDSYMAASTKVEQEFALGQLAFDPDKIIELETVLAVEKALLQHVEQTLLAAANKETLTLAQSRLSRFWSAAIPAIQAHWALIASITEVLRELRKYNYTEIIDRYFSLGSHLNARDVKAVRKTVSGLIKLLYPHGDVSKEELAELVGIALEGRRRVKEQLKKMGSFEYHQTSFSYMDEETREEHFVGVPEQGGRDMISTDPLAPGSVYTSSVDDQGKVGLYRLEIGFASGTGKLRVAGGIEGIMKESIQRAFAYMMSHKVEMGIGQTIDTTDFHVEAIDLLSNHVPCEAGIALVIAIYSAIKKHSVQPALMILGDLSIQGNIKSVRSLAEPLQVGMDNGARRALIPLENKRNFLDVSADIMERVDSIFYGDPMTGAMKALGMT